MTQLQKVKAFAPGNISCFFKPYDDKRPRWCGSYGLGFTVNEGVTVHTKKAKQTIIFFNGKAIDFPAVNFVIDKLAKESVEVLITSPLPLGSGFGLSGASALATAYALNKLLQLKKTKKQLAILAHTADVVNNTGLGDVVNQYFGGFLFKTEPSSQFVVKKIVMPGIHVYWTSFGSLSTKAVLSDRKLLANITVAADVALEKTKKLLHLEKSVFADLIDISSEFVSASGLLHDKRTKALLEKVKRNGGHASMIVVGNAVFSDKPFMGAKKLMISDVSAHLL